MGLITDDAERVGCSPDGLIGEDGGIEIKCPEGPAQIRYLLAGELPPEYVAQVQGSLFVTGRKWWRFLSYRRKYPSMMLTIEPDAQFQLALAEAIQKFIGEFDQAWAKLVLANGGPPSQPEVDNSSHPVYHIAEPACDPSHDFDDIIP